jgi:three-Cys-motif partner protein
MKDDAFFQESREQSLVKAEIVAKYFWAWAKVILPTAKSRETSIAYIDLFAGPGRYKDGAESTPLLILEQAVKDDDMKERLVTIFNDVDKSNSRDLETAISQIPNIDELKHEPMVYNSEVGTEIVKMFEEMCFVPTLFFVDPWGYKGLSLRLISSVLKDWGCDCIFFFNYNRINMGLGNPIVKHHMDALFGRERADELRKQLEPLSPEERELVIVEAISQSLKERGGKYVLPFCFRRANGERTSHHLIFVTKHVRGYEIMKEIMAKQSSSSTQGVPSFQYNPASEKQPLLFELTRPLDDLAELLLEEFAGKTLQMRQIYEQHHVETPYIKSNYKQVLINLEEQGKIITDPPADQRPKRKGEVTFADGVKVTFPKK